MIPPKAVGSYLTSLGQNIARNPASLIKIVNYKEEALEISSDLIKLDNKKVREFIGGEEVNIQIKPHKPKQNTILDPSSSSSDGGMGENVQKTPRKTAIKEGTPPKDFEFHSATSKR